MPTFKRLTPEGVHEGEVEYRPIIVKSGDIKHRLALHRVSFGWVVSDPVSGGRVCDVAAIYKGMRCSSVNLGPTEAARRAQEHIAALISRVTPDGFNKRLQEARKAYTQ
jgi:streptomycin 6-kinase